jgi:hypothetical protein
MFAGLAIILVLGWAPHAHAATTIAANKPALAQPFGQSAALQGGGTAATTDMSAVDHNPAGIATGRILSVEGATAWRKQNIQSSEAGMVDSVMSDVAAAFKFRQTSQVTGFTERRFTLGAADEVGKTGAIIGLAGDYKERPVLNEEGLLKDKGQSYELRAGVIYEIFNGLRVGVRTGGHFDKTQKEENAIGAAALLGPSFVINADTIFVREDAEKVTAGVGVIFNKYFDLRTSYGYHLDDGVQEGGAGLFLVTSKISVFYVANLPDLAEPLMEHQAGMRFNMAF